MDQLIQTIILGIIQGIAEWLPISSTGHLRLAEEFLDMRLPILFDVTLHVGTLMVVLFFFRSDIKNILSALARLDSKSENGQMIPLIIVGTVPTALIGLAFGDLIEITFATTLPIAIAFIACGFMLYLTKVGSERTNNINYSTAIAIGIAQGIAIIPGISRSGATIAVALWFGLKRDKAFKFSFLLSIPALIGALGLTLYKESASLVTAEIGWIDVLAGVIAAMIVGYFALKLLWKILTKKKFHLFAFYCWILGIALVLFGFGIV